jgi:hypothetical protein
MSGKAQKKRRTNEKGGVRSDGRLHDF